MKTAYFVATIALLSGCSLINSLDSVKPESEGNDSGTGGHAGKGGKGSGGRSESGGATGMSGSGGASGKGGTGAGGEATGGDTGAAGMDAGSGGSPADSGSGGTTGGEEAGTGGVPEGGTFTPGGPNGAIVAYDPDSAKTWVLDPTDGHLVGSNLSARILAIANDPATDYWYVFRQPGKVTDPAELQVRQLNTTTGKWNYIGGANPVPNPATPVIGILTQRLAYLSTPNPSAPNPATSGFTVLDTTNPAAVTALQRSRSINATGSKYSTSKITSHPVTKSTKLTSASNARLAGGSLRVIPPC